MEEKTCLELLTETQNLLDEAMLNNYVLKAELDKLKANSKVLLANYNMGLKLKDRTTWDEFIERGIK